MYLSRKPALASISDTHINHSYLYVFSPDDNVSVPLYRQGVKTISLDTISKFKIGGGRGRERNYRELSELQLPLPAFDPSIPGNPEYMVNILKLDKDKEYLRDSIFFQMFRSAILFDDMDTAAAYK